MSAAPARGRKVLAIRFGALGDLVLATCVLEALASESPPAEVHLLTKARFAPLFAGDPRVARVIAHSDGIGGSVSSLRAARRERYDLVLDLHATPRSRVIARAARAAERRAVDKRSRERRALVVRNPAAAGASPAPDVRLAGGVVGWYGEMMGGPLPEPRLIVPPGRLAEARALLERTGVREGFVAVAPFAARRTKEWLRDRMVRFLRDARRDDARMTLLLVGADADRDRLVSLASDGDVPFIAPPLALLPALLSLASCAVTTDSAPLHVAEAVDRPVVALFGPTVRAFGFAPRHARSVVLEIDLACRPCSLHGDDVCPLAHHRCLDEIDADRMIAAVRSVLAPRHANRDRFAHVSHGAA
jgi:heptosyltransferase-2